MKLTINKQDLGNPTIRATFVSFIDALKHGGFMAVKGFQPKYGYGEVQNGTFQKGISYGNALTRSLEQLDEIEANDGYSITVTHGQWINAKGEANPTARRSQEYPTFSKTTITLTHGDPILADAIAKVRSDIQRSIDGDTRPTVEYRKLGNGVYEHPETGVLYLRDLRRISKQVVVEGNYPNKASKPVNAVADALRRELSVGHYRMFRCDADFESITIDGVTIEPETETVDVLTTVASVPTSEAVAETVK